MTPKEYLSQYSILNDRINDKLDEQKRLRELSTAISPASGFGVTSGISDKVGKTVARIVDLELEINEDINRLLDLRKEIESVINKIENEAQRKVLRLRYIEGKEMKQIPKEMYYSYRWVIELHQRGLEQVKEFLVIPNAPVI